jgi:hypothetical protein
MLLPVHRVASLLTRAALRAGSSISTSQRKRRSEEEERTKAKTVDGRSARKKEKALSRISSNVLRSRGNTSRGLQTAMWRAQSPQRFAQSWRRQKVFSHVVAFFGSFPLRHVGPCRTPSTTGRTPRAKSASRGEASRDAIKVCLRVRPANEQGEDQQPTIRIVNDRTISFVANEEELATSVCEYTFSQVGLRQLAAPRT